MKGYNPETTTTGVGFQYHMFVQNFSNVYKELRRNGYDPQIKGMAWMQGESDLGDEGRYKITLKWMIADLRNDLYEITKKEDVKTMPFVIGKIATTFNSYANPLVPRMNIAQQAVANEMENVETIETSDLIIVRADGSINGSDRYHFNYRDMETLGMRFGEKIIGDES